jgi:hypothetical protein
MKTGWKNIPAFEQHIEEMATFRRAHSLVEPVKTAQRIPGHPTATANQENTSNLFTDNNGRVIVIPIWHVTIPGGTQN